MLRCAESNRERQTSQLVCSVRLVFAIVAVVVSGWCDAQEPEPIPAGKKPVAERPNIILIMADDLGWSDTGFQGNRTIHTPRLDELASRGMIFRRFYAASPVCSPTRGSCLTGRHPDRYRIPTANAGHLPAEEVTLAERLRDVGYVTGHFGKWHLGTMSPEYSGKGASRKPAENFMTPGMAGFDEWFSTEYAVATWDPYLPANAHGKFDPRSLYWENGTPIIDGISRGLVGCDSRIIVDRAIPFIRNAAKRNQPFFATIWFHAPHRPVIGGPEYLARYGGFPENQQHYFAVVTAMDHEVGRLVDQLRELKIDRTTMIWFCSDNGPEGNPGPTGRSQGSADPLRGRKRSLYEGGIRVPAFVVWPEYVAAGSETDVPAVTSDYLPTIMSLLGQTATGASGRPLDGMALDGVLKKGQLRRDHPICFRFGEASAVVDDRFKVVHHTRTVRHRSDNGKTPVAEWELYDLANDVGETTNVAERFPDEVQRLRTHLERWRNSVEESARDLTDER